MLAVTYIYTVGLNSSSTRHGATCFRVTAQLSHQADLTTSALVACATASTVQDRCPGLPESLNGLAPSYLADDCQLVFDVRLRRLRSSDSVTCAVRRTRTTYGDRCFAIAVPRVWNSVPTELRQSDSPLYMTPLQRVNKLPVDTYCASPRD